MKTTVYKNKGGRKWRFLSKKQRRIPSCPPVTTLPRVLAPAMDGSHKLTCTRENVGKKCDLIIIHTVNLQVGDIACEYCW
jgi:hypothetical protein